MKKKDKGFSLIELLATIFIISIILGITGYFVTNTIKNSEKHSSTLAINNIKKTASTYVEEYKDDVIWNKNEEKKNTYSCIAVNSLINKGYLNQEEVDKSIQKYIETNQVEKDNLEYIIVTKDENNTVISEEFDQNGTCSTDQNGRKKVAIPTAEKYCATPTYNELSEQVLTQNLKGNEVFSFNNNIGKDAGNYNVTAKLIDPTKYIWQDDTIEDKTITCSIKKAKPEITLSPTNGEEGTDLNDTKIQITTNTRGTISLKSSNKEIITAKLEGTNQIEKNTEKNMIIKKIATKKTTSYITITITPDEENQKNYLTNSTTYTVGNVVKKTVKKPTCNDVTYNGRIQNLVTSNAGYSLSMNAIQKEIGEYKDIQVKLNYGYIWSDNKTNSLTLTCIVKVPTPTVSYNTNGGSSCKNTKVTYGKAYGNLCTPTKTGYTFAGWQDKNNHFINETTIVTDFNNHTLNATWKANNYYLDINPDDNIHGADYKSGARVKSFDLRIVDENGKELYNKSGIDDYFENTGTYNSTYYISNITYRDGYQHNNYTLSHNKITVLSSQENAYTFKHNVDGNISVSINTKPKNYRLDINPDGNIYGANFSQGSHIKSFDLKIVDENGHELYNKSGIDDYFENTGTLNSTYYITNVTYKSEYEYLGYDFSDKNVAIIVADGTNFTFKHSVAADFSFSINTKGKNYTATMDLNGGTSYGNTPKTWTATYGNTYNIDGYIPSRTGYTFTGWYTSASGGTKFSENWTWTAENYTFYAQWRENVCTINFDADGGTFHGSSANAQRTLKYGWKATSDKGIWDASGGSYNAKRSNSDKYNHIRKSSAWISSLGTTFDQTKKYSATDFCPDLSSKDQTITLYVHWYRHEKRTKSCAAYSTNKKTCSSQKTYEGITVSKCAGYKRQYNGGCVSNNAGGKYGTSSYVDCICTQNTDCSTKYCSSYKWSNWQKSDSCSKNSTTECRTNYKR